MSMKGKYLLDGGLDKIKQQLKQDEDKKYELETELHSLEVQIEMTERFIQLTDNTTTH